MAARPDAFAALADSTRRLLLERLSLRECTVTELTEGLPISQAAISQHLRLLRDSGLVAVRPEGRHRHYSLRPDGLTELRSWLEELERFWTERTRALGAYLDGLEP
jgi:DNA-binding transcriptional ArsR family regulator